MVRDWIQNWQPIGGLDPSGYMTEGLNELAVGIVMKVFAGGDCSVYAEGFRYMSSEQKECFVKALNDHMDNILEDDAEGLKLWQGGFEAFNQSLCRAC